MTKSDADSDSDMVGDAKMLNGCNSTTEGLAIPDSCCSECMQHDVSQGACRGSRARHRQKGGHATFISPIDGATYTKNALDIGTKAASVGPDRQSCLKDMSGVKKLARVNGIPKNHFISLKVKGMIFSIRGSQ
jgi:hypothetical protein